MSGSKQAVKSVKNRGIAPGVLPLHDSAHMAFDMAVAEGQVDGTENASDGMSFHSEICVGLGRPAGTGRIAIVADNGLGWQPVRQPAGPTVGEAARPGG